ncbi:hypothetical protein [Paenibacillus sp. SN-8-1]|uniref:hypothetical protein n=1 Tax=Paenibacillus sp. SN-8-1 TaxID=3435409 RepID=UPI003D9A2234
MENVFVFSVSSEEDIKITLKQTESPLDLVKINYQSPKSTFVLHEDEIAFGAIETFGVMLNKAIQGELQLAPEYQLLGAGYHWNILTHQIPDCGPFDENPLEKFWLWSTPSSNGIQTWMYNINGNICIELSPNYSWHFTEPKVNDEYHSFESFIKNFSIVKRFSINVVKARLWHNKYEEILESISK